MLDIYLNSPEETIQTCQCSKCANNHEVRYHEHFFEINITHNLIEMAQACGIYKSLWHPEEIGITKGNELIAPINAALKLLKKDPTKFKRYSSSNGWGTYEGFIKALEKLLDACGQHPNAIIEVSR